ncbi:hypothetical protein NUH87_28405 [Pseudomonas batumici]|uniref:hypothetical protein n=1 Tax=Pseudomonas batumici TaxID=226910 RepID=UPI0030CF0EF1
MEADPLCLVFIPALVAVLRTAEERKGSPLTEAEVCSIRDQAVCITLPFSVALDMERERGYPDIAPENCWSEWKKSKGS